MRYQRRRHPYIFERLIGFSLPVCSDVALISYDAVHIVRVGNPELVTNYPELAEGGSRFDTDRQRLEFENRTFEILGLYGGTPISKNQFGERLAFGNGDEFFVYDTGGNEIFKYSYNDLSGDWRYVTFSADGRTILFGTPYDFEIFERQL